MQLFRSVTTNFERFQSDLDDLFKKFVVENLQRYQSPNFGNQSDDQ